MTVNDYMNQKEKESMLYNSQKAGRTDDKFKDF